MSTELVMPSGHLILCRPLLLPSIFPSIRVFSNESAFRIKRPKYWSFRFSISPSSEYSGLISFRIDWFDLLASQESSPAPQLESVSSLVLSLLFEHPHSYMTTGKAMALTIWTFDGKVMSLLLIWCFIIAFLQRSKWLLISLL